MLRSAHGQNPETGRPWEPADFFESIPREVREVPSEELVAKLYAWAAASEAKGKPK